MNQFDNLLAHISELENANRESERKYLTLSQRFNACEAELQKYREKLLECEEKEAGLREQVSSLRVEKETEHKLSQRLKEQNAQLKCSVSDQMRVIEEEKKQMVLTRENYIDGLKKNNARVQEAVNDLKDRIRKYELACQALLPLDSHVNPLNMDAESLESVVSASALQENYKHLNEELKKNFEKEKSKLESDLNRALKEYRALDHYNKQIQIQLDQIRSCYSDFEAFIRGYKCACGKSIELGQEFLMPSNMQTAFSKGLSEEVSDLIVNAIV
ncbi:kinesin-like protein KIF15 [Schistocerca gregaria]|uniref:kinesin-like protein KIF15 n=1 Tax=Schistocerca gregaria TaxID=7010 RepID=UPI00211E4041|nr:kinesin-like protein KIF15 [Schistocerca gregaria]